MLDKNSRKMFALLKLCRQLQHSTDKEQALELVKGFKYPNMLRKIFTLTVNPETCFGLTSRAITCGKYRKHLIDADERLKNFISYLQRLSDMETISEEQRVQIAQDLSAILQQTTFEERHFFLCLLDREWVGFDYQMAVKLWGKESIPISPDFMYADTYKQGMDLEYPVLAQACIDGERIKCLVRDGYKRAYDESLARRDTLFMPFLNRLDEFRTSRKLESIEVDFIVYRKDWETTFRALNESDPFSLKPSTEDGKVKKPFSKTSVYIADVIANNSTDVALEKRLKRVKVLGEYLYKSGLLVRYIPEVIVNNEREMDTYIEKCNAPRGLILKDLKSPYLREKTTLWLKVRPSVMTSYYATIEKPIFAIPDNISSLVALLVKKEDGIEMIINHFASNYMQVASLSEKGISLCGRTAIYKLDSQGNAVFWGIKPDRKTKE